MRKMKPSGVEWIGDIPQEWDIYKLKYLVTYNDEVLDEKTDSDFEFDYIDISSVEYQKGIVSLQRMRFSDAPSRARRIVREKDIIISTVRTYLKAVASIGFLTFPQIASTGFIVLRARNNKALSKFLHYAVLANSFISMVEAHSVGVSYPAINASDVVKIPISIPTLYEQKVIAEFLDRKCAEIDSIIGKTKATVEEYKALKQAVITQAVTKGIRPDRPMKDSGVEWIGEIPQEWKCLKSKCIITSLYSGAALTATDFVEDGFPVFGGGQRLGYYSDYNLEKTLVIGRVGAKCGCVTKVDEKAWATDNALIVTTETSIDYLFYILVAAQLNKLNTSNAQPLITSSKVLNFKMPFCESIDEQNEIVEYLDHKCAEIDRLIAAKEQLLTELESYKKSVIYEYVTGKKEI